MRRFGQLLMVMVLGLFLAACGNGETEEGQAESGEGQEEETLYIGMEAAYPPYNWTQNDDSSNALPIQNSNQYANGYDIQIANIISEELDRPVEIVKTAWEGIVPALQSGKIDLIVAGMTPTPEREEAILFTDPYYDMTFTMVTMEDSEYAGGTTVEDYENASVTGQQGTMNYDLLDQIPNADIQQALGAFSAMRVSLQSGKIDAYISEIPEAISATSAITDFTYAEVENFEIPEGISDYLAIGARHEDTELVEAINEILAGISEEDREEMMINAIENQPSEAEEE